MRLLRRIRGIVGTALTWATAWGLVGAVGFAIAALTTDLSSGPPLSSIMLTGAAFLGIYGFIAGAGFSLVLLAAERMRTLHQLTLRRVAAWGGLGGVLMAVAPVLSTGLDLDSGVFLLASTLLGAGSAAGSVAVARRGLPAGLIADPERRAIGGSAEPAT